VNRYHVGVRQQFVEIDAKDYRTKLAQQARDDAYAAGKVPVLSRELAEYRAVAKIFTDKREAQVDDQGRPDPIILDGVSEHTGVFEVDGVLCRLRADHWRPDALELLDLKTTGGSVSRKAINRFLYVRGADIQRHHYVTGAEAIEGAAGRVRKRFAFLEVKPPFDVVVAELSGKFVELGRRRWKRGFERWQACLDAHAKGDERAWPGHSGGRTLRMEPAKWMEADDMESEVDAFVPSTPDF